MNRSKIMTPSDRMNHQIIADNCIQMAAVNWCKVFASKKSKTYYAAGTGINRKQFLSSVAARGISFQETRDRMRSFQDKGVLALLQCQTLKTLAGSAVKAVRNKGSAPIKKE